MILLELVMIIMIMIIFSEMLFYYRIDYDCII